MARWSRRPGSRPSHEQAAATFDKAIALCMRAGFKSVRLLGDTDFSQTGYLDGWYAAGVKFVFGLRAAQNLYEHVENLPRNAWQQLDRPAKHRIKTEPRQRRTNPKQQVVEDHDFKDIRLVKEYVTDFRHRPLKCGREYRIVVLWKDPAVHEGQRKLFDVPSCLHGYPNADREDESTHRLQNPGMESLAASLLPLARPASGADALLTPAREAGVRMLRSPFTPDRTKC